jgi:hypothetical protein
MQTRVFARRSLANLIAVVGLAAPAVFPESTIAVGWRNLALAYILIDLLLRVRAGIVRRSPYWTRDSWRRYLLACTVPVVSLIMMVLMMIALERRLPFVGASQTPARAVSATVMLVFMLVGAIGTVMVIEWLHDGDPSRQFAIPRWLSFGRRKSPGGMS